MDLPLVFINEPVPPIEITPCKYQVFAKDGEEHKVGCMNADIDWYAKIVSKEICERCPFRAIQAK